MCAAYLRGLGCAESPSRFAGVILVATSGCPAQRSAQPKRAILMSRLHMPRNPFSMKAHPRKLATGLAAVALLAAGPIAAADARGGGGGGVKVQPLQPQLPQL